jgi:hypothetical protein
VYRPAQAYRTDTLVLMVRVILLRYQVQGLLHVSYEEHTNQWLLAQPVLAYR